MATDGDDQPEEAGSSDGADPPAGDDGEPTTPESLPPPSERANPLVSSLCAGLVSADEEMAEQSGIALALVARHQPDKTSTIIGRLVEQIVASPDSEQVVRTLATLRGDDHGREIRGALMTETGYSDARRLYGLIEHSDSWDLSEINLDDLDAGDADLSFVSAVMRLVELENEGRDPVGSDAWTRFIQRLPGEGGAKASEGEIELAAARQDSRPRSVRRRHERIEQIANSRTFQIIEAQSRFDELEVLSPVRKHRFGKAIRVRGLLGAEEYALLIRLPHQIDQSGFRQLLVDRLREWNRIEAEHVVTVTDWGETPRPWIATDVVGETLATRDRLPVPEALEHAQTLSRALVTLHQHGIVHGGLDPRTIGYPPSTFDDSRQPMIDSVGLVSVYRRFADPEQFLDIRYGAPEQFDGQHGGIDAATDMYHLGMVLYRACTGRPPFDGDADAVREQVRTGSPVPPSKQQPNLPDSIDEIIAKATAKQKLLRYENAMRFHQEIRRLCGDRLP